jgi:hypothetical protein
MVLVMTRRGDTVKPDDLSRLWRSRILWRWLTVAATLGVLAIFLAVSIGTMLRTADGTLLLVWIGCWALGAGVVGWWRRSWRWPLLCPLAMIALVLLWEAFYGPSSWSSTYVFMLGVVFAIAATIGAFIGTALGKRSHPKPRVSSLTTNV